jgi:hypothetical protein
VGALYKINIINLDYEIVSSVTGNDLIQLLTAYKLYRSQNAQ